MGHNFILRRPGRIPSAPPSPGPWRVDLTGEARFNGSVLILDAFGEIVAWATDAAGHTTEAALPDRRQPDVILANAALIAQAHELLGIAELAYTVPPILRQRLRQAGVNPHHAMEMMEARAGHVLRRLGMAL